MRLNDNVRDVLQRSKIDGLKLHLPEQLERSLYTQVAKVLDLLGGKWNKKAGAIVFQEDASAVVADAVATGTVLDFKKVFQFFETPAPVVKLVVDAACLVGGASPHHVLEPSAGRGAIAKELRQRGCGQLFVCELWEENQKLLEKEGFNLICSDFLKLQPSDHPRGFDRIVANPPFSRGQDIEHVLHMRQLLAMGGRLVSVMSPGWTFREDHQSKDFRKRVEAEHARWEELPDGSFKESGTNVRAGYLVWDRLK